MSSRRLKASVVLTLWVLTVTPAGRRRPWRPGAPQVGQRRDQTGRRVVSSTMRRSPGRSRYRTCTWCRSWRRSSRRGPGRSPGPSWTPWWRRAPRGPGRLVVRRARRRERLAVGRSQLGLAGAGRRLCLRAPHAYGCHRSSRGHPGDDRRLLRDAHAVPPWGTTTPCRGSSMERAGGPRIRYTPVVAGPASRRRMPLADRPRYVRRMGDAPTWGPPWAEAPWPVDGRRLRVLARVLALVLLVVQLGGSTAAAQRQPQARPARRGRLPAAHGGAARPARPAAAPGRGRRRGGRCGRHLPGPRVPARPGGGQRRPRAGGRGRVRTTARRLGGRGLRVRADARARRAQRPPVGLGAALAAAAWLSCCCWSASCRDVAPSSSRRPAGPARRSGRPRRATSGWRSPATCTTSSAHSLSLINVQAGVALHLLDEHPEQARPALTAIKDASRRRWTRCAPCWPCCARTATLPRAPAPALADVDALVAAGPAGGLQVDLAPERWRTRRSGCPSRSTSPPTGSCRRR